MHPKEAIQPPQMPQPPQTPPGASPLRRGAPCPNCGQAALDYNGLLELECPRCGFSSSSGAGCT